MTRQPETSAKSYNPKDTPFLFRAGLATTGAAAIGAASSELPEIIGHAGEVISNGLDVYGIAVPVIEAIPTFRRIHRTRHERPRMPGRLSEMVLQVKNLGLNEQEMRGEVAEWAQKRNEKIDKDIAVSKRAEQRKGLKAIWYPLAMGMIRSGVLIAQQIPHVGNVVADLPQIVPQVLAHPHLLAAALHIYFTNPYLILPTIGVVVAAALAGVGGLFLQKAETFLHKYQKVLVADEVGRLNALFNDDKRNSVERFIDAARNSGFVKTASRLYRAWKL